MDVKMISIVVLAGIIQQAAASPLGGLCGENEWTNGCGSPCEVTCDNPYTVCIQVCAGNPCRCIDGHVRHNGKCIPLESCPKKECPRNAVWDFCGQYCEPSCDEPEPLCPGICTQPSCICTEGHVKNAKGNCVKKEECPNFQLTTSRP